MKGSAFMRHAERSIESVSRGAVRPRRGVLLLVVLSMLTLFLLLGVTYLVLASRVRSTSRAFLKLADDQAHDSVATFPLLRRAAMQVSRGAPSNARSVIKGHDLLADKYGDSSQHVVVGGAGGTAVLSAAGQLLKIPASGCTAEIVCGCILTFNGGEPASIANTSARIVHAEQNGANCWLYVARPARLLPGDDVGTIQSFLINGRDFSGDGFSQIAGSGGSTMTLDNTALLPNPNFAVLHGTPNEDYDAIDEQNWAIAPANAQPEKSFHRQTVLNHWTDGLGPATLRATAVSESNEPWRTGSQLNSDLLPLRRATLRPFAFDHWQDTYGGTDFTGKSLASFDVITNGPGDVDNDGDGVVDSLWLDLGESAVTLRDGTTVKPLFAIHCIDLGGRINVNAHGSPSQLNESSVVSDTRLAVDRGAAGSTKKLPKYLRGGLGFGPADVRLDAVLNPDDVSAVMLGAAAPGGLDDGIRRDLPPIVGRYGDGVSSASAPAFPGQPATNDRRSTNPATLWTDRGLPDQYWPKNGTPSLFGGNPPDLWARLSAGVDHRGHPVYIFRNSGVNFEATDNPYELDLFRAKPSDSYAGNSVSWVDQPITAAELEAVLRPFDIDDAAGLPPRALAIALSGNGGQLDLNRAAITSESWDTPAVISTDLAGVFTALDHDPDLVAGLKMDLNRPMGDAVDSDGDKIVDEPGEINDTYSVPYLDGWLLTRGIAPSVSQPGQNEPHLRARQLFAWNIFNLAKTIKTMFAAKDTDNSLRLFAVLTDTDSTTPPVAVDESLNSGGIGNTALQDAHNDKVLAQWAVNVVDFLDADAIMTPFRFSAGSGVSNVVWGCELPDLMISETVAFHDRRTADTKCDTTKELTTDFRNQYQAKYNTWMAWKNGGMTGLQPPYPQPTNADATASPDDMDFDQVRIPEGSLFIELYGTRSPTTPNLPRELYSYVNGKWYLDLGRTPQPDTAPVWRLSVSTNRTAKADNDVFQVIKNKPDTTWLSPGTNKNQVSDTIDIDRYIWLSTVGASVDAQGVDVLPNAPAMGPNKDNTFYVQEASGIGNPLIQPGGYLVVGPRVETALGSIQGGSGAQKWGVPSKQRIKLQQNGSSAAPAAGVYDLQGELNPTPTLPNSRTFGNPLPPPVGRTETTATWVAMDPPTSGAWSSWNKSTMDGIGKSGIGLNVSEPLRNAYYSCPTTKNPLNSLFEAYGALDDDTHTNFLPTPLDQAGPLAAKMLSGGTYANFCTVFVERLADPTKPHEPDAEKPGWNPYIVTDFMPIDLTVFNGEAGTPDPSETQGPDRGLADAIVGPWPISPVEPLAPSKVPLPIGGVSQLTARQTYFHTRQRGFGKDLPNYDNDQTLFGTGGGKIYRNLHPFKPIGSLDDIQDTPLATVAAGTNILPGGKPTQPRSPSDLSASEKAYLLHELGQSPGSRAASPSAWQAVPYHSLGWVNSSFGRRLDTNDGVPPDYVGSPDRPFPWIVWNDRPFANPYELLYVPRTPPGRFFTNYRNLDYPKGTSPDPMPYPMVASSTYNADDLFAACTPGAHLLPISSITDVPAPGATRTRNADLLVRLFEYVRVRSPFTGTETAITGIGDDGRPSRFVGPFNRLSRYREPGRINLNTIDASFGPKIWNALCSVETGSATPPYETTLSSTSSFRTSALTSGTCSPFRIARGTRTDFSSPSRGCANTLFPQAWAPAAVNDRLAPRAFTLFGDLPASPTKPLFPAPTFESCGNDGEKNAWFRFDTLIRANTNSTVRSEVYAIWVTMGLFEVEPVNATNERYPDGYRLVREYGGDTGEVNRHRAFYIFDRSIPVGYKAGTDLNVQDAILVERFIE